MRNKQGLPVAGLWKEGTYLRVWHKLHRLIIYHCIYGRTSRVGRGMSRSVRYGRSTVVVLLHLIKRRWYGDVCPPDQHVERRARREQGHQTPLSPVERLPARLSLAMENRGSGPGYGRVKRAQLRTWDERNKKRKITKKKKNKTRTKKKN